MRDNRDMSEVPQNTDDEERTTVTIRRAPKFSVFVVVGALVGLIATLVLTSLFPTDPAVGFAASFGYFALYGIPLGGVLGAAIAIGFDYRANRRPATVIASKLAMHAEVEHAPAGENSSDHSSSDHSAQRSDG